MEKKESFKYPKSYNRIRQFLIFTQIKMMLFDLVLRRYPNGLSVQF